MKRTIITIIMTAIITAASITAYITCKSNFINMNTVTSYDATETGLMLYNADGTGYYWEYRGME